MLYGVAEVAEERETDLTFADKIAADFTEMLNEWHSRPETWDNGIDEQIHRWYAAPPKVFPKRPYFSPSAATACSRELYEKGIGSKRDIQGQPPYQKRWTQIGTAIGDMIQRDLLFIEKHMEGAKFRFLRNERGEPMFEDFAKVNVPISLQDGTYFYLYGTPDGIMEYTADDGKKYRVGLEIKSKQTSAARTSLYSMRGPEEKHVAQCRGYSIMFDVDYYIILYVNCAKKAWVMSDDDFEKTPDIRAFGIEITQHDRNELVERLADVQRMINDRKPPMPDLTKWTFNGFKTAIARSLSAEDMQYLKKQVDLAKKSGLSEREKAEYIDALADLEKIREKVD